MASCTFKIEGNSIPSELQKVTREHLYGSTGIRAVDGNQEALQRAGVSEEGDLYLGSGDVARAIRAGEHYTLAPSELVDSATGLGKDTIPSSFKASPDFRKASVDEISLLEVVSVYQLPGLNLTAGSCYLGVFNYRDGIERNDAGIVANTEGAFLLVGKLKKPTLTGLEIDSEIIAEAAAQEESAGAADDFEALF